MNWKTETTVTDEQVRFYREKGYLTFGRLFTEEELEDLRGCVDGLIAALPPERRPESLDVPHFEHPFLFRFLAHPRVLDVIERFVGPDIVLWSKRRATSSAARRRPGRSTMRYCPAHVRHAETSDRPGGHRIYLLRGQDRSGGHNRYTPVPAIEQRTA